MRQIAFREALREAMNEEMRRDEKVFLMGEEVAEYNGAYKVSQGMLEEFGAKRVIDTPIAELGFTAIAVGAAQNGLRPIVEYMTWNFANLALDQILNTASKMLAMSGGQVGCPIVFRGANGSAGQLGAQHSTAYESMYANIPGLKVISVSNPYDAKGLLKSAIRDDDPVIFMESEVNKAGSVVTSTVNSEMFDKNGKSVAKASNKIQCDGGVMMMDMKMFIPSQQMEQMKNAEATGSASYLEYPASMNIGDKLKDGKFNMDVTNNGLTTTLDMDMTNRSVEAKEKVTSPAGNWDAFKITYNSKIKMKIAGIGIPVNTEVTEWYVPDFGVVKTESKYGSTLITAIK